MTSKANPFGIYLHIPFCVSKCRYCDFYSIDNFNKEIVLMYGDKVLETVEKVIKINNGTLVSFYIGGGTPSLMPDKWFADLFQLLSESENIINTETTVEINPGYISAERLKFFSSLGINRFSIGIQSFNDKLLSQIGRNYSVSDISHILLKARDIIENLSFDMIYGFNFPQRNIGEEFKKILNIAVPDHFSVYAYTPPYNRSAPETSDEDSVAYEEELIAEILRKNSFLRYEVSNYAKSGKESVHNNLYWKWETYIGIGAGAHSFFKEELERAYYEENVLSFIKNPVLLRRKLEKRDAVKEFIMMGLRRSEGIFFSSFTENFSMDAKLFLQTKEIETLLKNDMIVLSDERLSVSGKGFSYLSDVTNVLFEMVDRSFE